MAYPYVSNSCMDEDHGACTGKENTPTASELTRGVAGGGFCICPCHGGEPFNQAWYDEVRAYSEERRRRDQVG